MATTGTSNYQDGRGRLRLAVISTPRSGNTWLRMQLAALFGLEQLPVHHPDEIDWDNLPERSVIQLHWWPVDDFLERLRAHEIRVVVLARHPLDVLMSWLNLAYYKHQDGRCPGGGACTECGIAGTSPASAVFLDYARGEYARLLLEQSPKWWTRPEVLRARYEDLVTDTVAALGRLVEAIGEPTVRSIPEVAAEHSISQMRSHVEVWRFQCWHGQSGLWRYLLPAAAARAIRETFPEAFELLGYACDPDEALTPLEAELNWARLQLDAARDHLIRACQKQAEADREMRGSRREMEASQRELERVYDELHAEWTAHEETRKALAAAEERLRHPAVVWVESSRLKRPIGGVSRRVLKYQARRPKSA